MALNLLDIYNDLIKEEKRKAGKDYDKDGKIESPEDEYRGVKDRAIKKARVSPKKKATTKKKVEECWECEEEEQMARDWNRTEDHEASMAKSELLDMMKNASNIHKTIKDGDNLPGWVSAYITLASDYMHSVSEYLNGRASEKNL